MSSDTFRAAGLGFWLGVVWGLTQTAVLSLTAGWVPPGAALIETGASAILWALASAAIAYIGRPWVRGRIRLHTCVLMSLFFFVYGAWGLVYHLVTLTEWRSAALGLGAFGALVVLAGTMACRIAAASPHAATWPGLLPWVLAAGLGCGLLVWGADIGKLAPGPAPIAIFLAIAWLATLAMLAALVWAPAASRTEALAAVALVTALLVVPIRSTPLAIPPSPPGSPDAAGPPVILISLDTTRADHLSVYGYRRDATPRLAEFAREARLFQRAYATSSWTLPTHASVFTGRLPVEHGAHHQRGGALGARPQALDPELATLAERFAKRGYRTAAIAANPLAVAPEFGLDRGFQQLAAERRLSFDPFHLTFLRVLRIAVRHPLVDQLLVWYWPADKITEVASAWVVEHADEPFLLFVNYLDPHNPRVRRGSHADRGADRTGRGAGATDVDDRTPGSRRFIARYDAEIRFMDRHLGRFFDELRRVGVFDRALIAVFSDHGEFLGEHDARGHGLNLDEPVQRAALLIRYPGGRHAGVEPAVTTLADVPVLVEGALNGLRPDEALGARGPVVTGEKYPTATERGKSRWGAVEHLVAVHWKDLKLVAHPDGWRLFDLERDPLETRDVSSEYPEETQQMRRALERWRETARAPAQEIEPDAESVELLRALGYVE